MNETHGTRALAAVGLERAAGFGETQIGLERGLEIADAVAGVDGAGAAGARCAHVDGFVVTVGDGSTNDIVQPVGAKSTSLASTSTSTPARSSAS